MTLTALPAASPPMTVKVPWRIAPDHPALAGHFPGQPILPGVLLLAQALEVAAQRWHAAWAQGPVTLASAKFLAPLRPGDDCVVELHGETVTEGRARLRFDIRRGETLAATGVMERAITA